MTPLEFQKLTNVSHETLGKLVEYQKLLEKWQARINLVGPATLPEAWERHFWDSAQLFPLLPAKRGPATLYDLGTGAGFPGLVLAIMATDGKQKLDVHLVESDQRKAAFLGEVCRAVGLARAVTIHVARVDRLKPSLPKADIVTARALASLPELLAMAEPLLDIHGICLFPKGARAVDELTQASKGWKMTVERLPSRTEPAGTILRISDLHRV